MSSQQLSTPDLLARVETTPIGARTRFLAAYARAHASDDDFAVLLAELAEDGAFAAELSLFLARVAGNHDHIGSLLAHEDPALAIAAVKAAAAVGGLDDAIESAVLDGARVVRVAAYKALRAWGRAALADRLLPRVRERFGDCEAAKLLTACGDAVVAEALPELAHVVTAWATLARRHPGVFAEYAERSLAELPSAQWAQWWAHHAKGIASAAEADPAAWLRLFERFWVDSISTVVGSLLPRLITADHEAAWRFVLAPERAALIRSVHYQRGALRRLAERDTATIAAFVRACPSPNMTLNSLMPLLAPPRREAALAVCQGDRPDALMYRQVSPHLPKQLRHKTVRRRLSQRVIADNRMSREGLRAYLPFAEVRDELTAATARSSADERATAYGHLIRCAGLDGPEAVTAMLGALDRLARDQDPVHVSALAALAKVPAHHWRESHLTTLGDLIGAVLGSPWRSRLTNQGLLRLASRLLLVGMSHGRPAFIEFGYARLERITAECGSRDVADALRQLPPRVAVELCRRLAPVVSGQAEVGRFKLALVFAEALGHRASEVPELRALLREATRSPDGDTVRQAASIWAAVDADAATELVEADAAMAAVPEVFDRLVRERTDVLARWLDEPGDVAPLLRPLSRAVTRRWPTAVRRAYLAALAPLARDERRSGRERAMAVRAMSRVAGLRIEDLDGLLDGRDPASSTAALAALDAAGPLERTWDLLTERASGPDAFVAGIGLVRLAKRMRPGFLAERIAPMLDSGTVAARKQGVRLMLEHRLPDAEAALQRLWDEESLPEGVREAIVAGLVHRLDEPWAGRIVADSLRFGADAAAPVLSAAPLVIAPSHRAAYADLMAEVVESGDERLVEAAVLRIGRWAPYSGRVKEALIGVASDLDATANWDRGMPALRDLAVRADDWEPLLEAARRLRSDERVEPNATAERDSPVRQRLERLVELLEPSYRSRAVDAVPSELIDLLPVDLGTRLLFATVSWEADAARVRRLAARIGDPVEAYELAQRLKPRLHMDRSADLLPFFERLASSGVPNACVLAAAAIGVPGSMAGWPPEWRELLRRLRDYPASEVSRLACGVYTSKE